MQSLTMLRKDFTPSVIESHCILQALLFQCLADAFVIFFQILHCFVHLSVSKRLEDQVIQKLVFAQTIFVLHVCWHIFDHLSALLRIGYLYYKGLQKGCKVFILFLVKSGCYLVLTTTNCKKLDVQSNLYYIFILA